MEEWIELRKKPTAIGCSRGFIIDTEKIRLKADETYVIKVIPERNLPKEARRI